LRCGIARCEQEPQANDSGEFHVPSPTARLHAIIA
jgi:hypothetical protein